MTLMHAEQKTALVRTPRTKYHKSYKKRENIVTVQYILSRME